MVREYPCVKANGVKKAALTRKNLKFQPLYQNKSGL